MHFFHIFSSLLVWILRNILNGIMKIFLCVLLQPSWPKIRTMLEMIFHNRSRKHGGKRRKKPLTNSIDELEEHVVSWCSKLFSLSKREWNNCGTSFLDNDDLYLTHLACLTLYSLTKWEGYHITYEEFLMKSWEIPHIMKKPACFSLFHEEFLI